MLEDRYKKNLRTDYSGSEELFGSVAANVIVRWNRTNLSGP